MRARLSLLPPLPPLLLLLLLLLPLLRVAIYITVCDPVWTSPLPCACVLCVLRAVCAACCVCLVPCADSCRTASRWCRCRIRVALVHQQTAKMLLSSFDFGCSEEALSLAACLSVQHLFVNPRNKRELKVMLDTSMAMVMDR